MFKPKKVLWIITFEKEVMSRDMELAVDIDWYDAIGLYDRGYIPEIAAQRYIELQKEKIDGYTILRATGANTE